ncbi:MAG TPA: asparagine synthase-related protein [Anaerolineae bacterium]|nr:asparagine synthase-related protein [Anaerolineae bacterium]HQI83599.1 asparagine synthase-related protein [Anaerolineae bacterium]
MDDAIYTTEDGTLFTLIGSPVSNGMTLKKVADKLADPDNTAFELPWEGRCVLLRISASGQDWTMWNDWTGSIPVFHTQLNKGYIASTLEPAVVAAAGFTPEDFFLPGLVSLLVNGHFLGDWTLFKDMYVVPPDCVARWGESGFDWQRLWSVKPSDERWDRGWDELVDEMYELSHHALANTLQTQSEWILPLSGGLDSRLIAAVGAELGVTLHTYTYGHEDWVETVFAKQVARVLDLPWQRIPIEPDYLKKYTRMWLEWFGSALHCHGMYQMPFLDAVKDFNLPIVTGFIGDPLAGEQTAGMMKDSKRSVLERLLGKWQMCSIEDAQNLISRDLGGAWDAINLELQQQETSISGSLYQRIWLIFQWNHVFGFSYYQPMMYDYWKSVGTPYVSKNLANFCLSLPRCALDDRRLQKDMLRRYYPKMASIGGTFGEPLTKYGRYYLKRAVARRLPQWLRISSLREFATTGNQIQIEALRVWGESCLWPLNEKRKELGALFNLDYLDKIYQQAAAGNEKAYNRLRPIQSVAWHYVRD